MTITTEQLVFVLVALLIVCAVVWLLRRLR